MKDLDIEIGIRTVSNIFTLSGRQEIKLKYTPKLCCGDILEATGWTTREIIIVKNNEIVYDLREKIMVGDKIVLYPNVRGADALKIVGLVVLAVVAWYVGGPLLALGVVGVGAAIQAGVFSPESIDTRDTSEGSPTYSWDNPRNTADEGRAIPVTYGEERFAPQIINFYIEIDDDGDEWFHMLLCVGEGETDLPVTDNEVYINQEPITIYKEDEYEVLSNVGSNDPGSSTFTHFKKLHQLHGIDKQCKGHSAGTNAFTLLHCNGSNGSTTITEDGYYLPDTDWRAYGGARITTSNPWDGTGCLRVLDSADYATKNVTFQHMLRKTTWDFECRLWRSNDVNNGIAGQKGAIAVYESFMGFFFDAGSNELCFTWYFRIPHYDDPKNPGPEPDWYSYVKMADCRESVNLSTGTWHHVRVARSGAWIYLFANGTYLGRTATDLPNDASNVGVSYIGRSFGWLSGPAQNQKGRCRLDEVRFVVNQHMYVLDDYTPEPSEDAQYNPEVYYTKGDVDRLTLFFLFPTGLYRLNNEAELRPKSVDVQIRYRGRTEPGGPFGTVWNILNETFTGESRYPLKFDVKLATIGRREYEIEIYRMTPDDGDDTMSNSAMHWYAVDEVLDEKLRYPNLQCVSVSLKASEAKSGSVPTIEILSRRSILKDTVVVAGVTIGYYDLDAANNAHAAYDMMTNPLYGSGLSPFRFDWGGFGEWRDWCDGQVEGQNRCELNTVFDVSQDLDRALSRVEGTGRARVIPRGTEITALVDKPGTAAFVYSAGNVLVNSEKVTYLPTTERSDAVEIRFRNKDKHYAEDTIIFQGEGFHYLTRTPNISKISLPGITNKEQAMREAIYRQQLVENTKKKVEFDVGVDGIMSLPGDIIKYQEGGSALSYGGRVATTTSGTTVYIDRPITLASSTYSGNCQIGFILADDTEVWRTVTGPFDTETEALTISSTVSIAKYNVYLIIATSQSEAFNYRITNMSRAGSSQIIKVEAAQYTDSAYYHFSFDSGNVAV